MEGQAKEAATPSPETAAKVKQLLIDGWTLEAIATEVGWSKSRVHRWLQKLNLPIRRPRQRFDERIERRIESLINRGTPYNEIAKRLGVHCNMVRRVAAAAINRGMVVKVRHTTPHKCTGCGYTITTHPCVVCSARKARISPSI